MLVEAERDYDLVIVDSPPLLGFAEPLQMAAVVDGWCDVMAGQTTAERWRACWGACGASKRT